MQILQAFETLVDNILFMDVFQDIGTNDSMQVCVHEIEHQINVTIIFSPDNILQSDNVFMTSQFLQENDLTECPLSVSRILKGIEVLLERDYLLGPFVNSFPDDSISTFAKPFSNFVPICDMLIYFPKFILRIIHFYMLSQVE